MPQILKLKDAMDRLNAGETLEQIFGKDGTWTAKLVGPQVEVQAGDEKTRSLTFVISTDAVDRYTDSVKLGGWRIAQYERNPVVLWAHDDQIPAIGKASETRIENKALKSTATFAEREIHPLADTIYRLLVGKFLRAASVGFVPLKFKAANEPGRQFGLDIMEQELLEWSVVNIPANPECLVLGRSAGIDTQPLYEWAERVLDSGGRITIPRTELEALRKAAKMPKQKRVTREAPDWKVGASRDLPIGEDTTWDGPGATARMLNSAGFDGDNPEPAKARRGFLVHDAGNPDLKGSYKLPFADIVDGRLKAMPAGIRAAASRLPQTDIPQAAKDEARAVLDGYEQRMNAGSKSMRLMRGLCEVGQLAWIIDQLACIEDWISVEADLEQDGSDIPARLVQALNTLGLILVDMTKEEVAELLADQTSETDEPMMMMADTPAQRVVLALAGLARKHLSTRYVITAPQAVSLSVAERIKETWQRWWDRPTAPLILDSGCKLTAIKDGRLIDVTAEPSESVAETVKRRLDHVVRAGRVLSAKNEADLKEAAALIANVLAQVIPEEDKDGAQERARKARATRLKLATPAA